MKYGTPCASGGRTGPPCTVCGVNAHHRLMIRDHSVPSGSPEHWIWVASCCQCYGKDSKPFHGKAEVAKQDLAGWVWGECDWVPKGG